MFQTALGGKHASISRIIVVLIMAAVVPVYASIVFASGAGPLPGSAEDLTGQYPDEIIGTLPETTDPLLGVNMFEIDILDPAAFSAMVMGSAFGIPDTVLALFDSSGLGVYLNDDLGGGDPLTYSLSCLPSAVGNPCLSPQPTGVGPVVAGIYYLAISLGANYPASASGEIFSPVLSTDVVGPDPANGGGAPINGWDGNAFPSSDTDLINYDILLTGTTPEPSTWILTGIGYVCLIFLRPRPAFRKPETSTDVS